MRIKRISAWLLILAIITNYGDSVWAAPIEDIVIEKPVKNVIILIPDGTSLEVATLSRWYNGGQETQY